MFQRDTIFFAWRIGHWFYRGQERPDLQPDSWDQFRRFGFVAPIRVGRLVRPVFKYFWDRTMSRGSGRCGVRWKSPRSPEWNLLFDSNVSQRKGFIAKPADRETSFSHRFLPSKPYGKDKREKRKKKIKEEGTTIRDVCATSVKIMESSPWSFVCRYAGR